MSEQNHTSLQASQLEKNFVPQDYETELYQLSEARGDFRADPSKKEKLFRLCSHRQM